MEETGLFVTFTGGALIGAAATHHVWMHGFHEFWRFPLTPTTQAILNVGGQTLFIGATATFAFCAIGLLTN
jgi:hypothetical protein